MPRKKLIAANWKMYKNPTQTREFFREFLPLVAGHTRDEIVVCPPYIDLCASVAAAKGSQVAVGAQNLHWEKEGAYTGEICPVMLLDVGCMTPIVCVGEVLEEREAGLTEDILRRQCLRAFHAISGKKAGKLVVAYEPVWAIGTGKTATPQLASDAHVLIRGEAAKAFGQGFADKLRILYGGSVKPENAKALMSEEEIDGALVGGASLDPKSFAAIVKY